MSTDSLHQTRVAQAQAEVGQTEVLRPVALTLVAICVSVIVAVPITQIWMDHRVLHVTSDAIETVSTRVDGPSRVARVIAGNRQMLAAIQRFTDRLDNRFPGRPAPASSRPVAAAHSTSGPETSASTSAATDGCITRPTCST